MILKNLHTFFHLLLYIYIYIYIYIISISSDFSTLFDSFNLALSHSLDIFAPSITLKT